MSQSTAPDNPVTNTPGTQILTVNAPAPSSSDTTTADPSYGPEEPSVVRFGAPAIIPQSLAGKGDFQPGDWAKYIETLPWRAAREGDWVKSPAMGILRDDLSPREPLLRTSKQWASKRLDERIAKSIVNLQSAFMQFTEGKPENFC